jgi:hypothetical protein
MARRRDRVIAIVRRRHGPEAAEAVQTFRSATGPLREHLRARVADYVGELGLEMIDAVVAGLTIGEAARLIDGLALKRLELAARHRWPRPLVRANLPRPNFRSRTYGDCST